MIRKMRKLCLLVIGALLLVLTGSANKSEAGISVNIGVNLPAYRFAGPPEVVVIPGTYVYMVPDIDVDILFFQGYWWRPYKGHWYRSRDYKGSWRYVEPRRIPRGLRGLPHDYRHRLSPGYERVPHRDLERNWKKWEREKYWDRRGAQGRGRHSENDRWRHDDQDRRGHDDNDRGGRDRQKGRH
jgi:hypothetical protein